MHMYTLTTGQCRAALPQPQPTEHPGIDMPLALQTAGLEAVEEGKEPQHLRPHPANAPGVVDASGWWQRGAVPSKTVMRRRPTRARASATLSR